MIVINETVNAKFVRRINSDAAVAVGEFERLEDANVSPLASQATGARLIQNFDERLRGAVKDRQFERINFDEYVVDSKTIGRREQMLGRKNQHALTHEARGVTDFGDVCRVRGDLEVIEVRTSEDHTCIGRRRHKAHARVYGRVKTDAVDLDRALDRKLITHFEECLSYEALSGPARSHFHHLFSSGYKTLEAGEQPLCCRNTTEYAVRLWFTINTPSLP